MKSKLSLKIGTILCLTIMLLLPLSMISGKITERSAFREEARASVAESWTGEQSMYGPILVQPYVESTIDRVWKKDKASYFEKVTKTEKRLYLIPEEVAITSQLKTEYRHRGIYPVTVYTSDSLISGSFSNGPIIELTRKSDYIELKQPYLAVNISDIRGLDSSPKLTWQAKPYAFAAGSKLALDQGGLHSNLEQISTVEKEVIDFAFSLELRGMGSINIAPIGKRSTITISSQWPHPKFEGRYLPKLFDINDNGFSATWHISNFGSSLEQQMSACHLGSCQELTDNTFGVSLIEPVDIYFQSERSVKYGIVFIGLTFIAFFLFETLKQLPIHPIQYTLVGMALSVFYLLLISLSEHLSFGWSYFIAGLSCVGLLSFYITHILKGIKRGLIFGAVFSLLYITLYIIIRSEDHALLLGSGLLFITLTATMYLTKNTDWYDVGNTAKKKSMEQTAKATVKQ